MEKLLSEWGEKLNREMPLAEYPRMQMQRSEWLCLNGRWEYQIVKGNLMPDKDSWKTITVPFALGSKLCGSDENLMPGDTLWYRKQFSYKPTPHRTILHFEAVDQGCTVYLNGVEAGRHTGGYAPFSVDISTLVKYQNSLMVRVSDHTDQGICTYGKQRLEHHNIWYTPTAGIWGTVWLEDLPDHAIEDIKITPDFDNEKVYIQLAGEFPQAVITVASKGVIVHKGITKEKHYEVPMPGFRPWTPDDPFLYDLYVQSDEDTVKSYFGMRKFSVGRDSAGEVRFCLNNKPLFLSGILDQGFSVDGHYTYPSDEAMLFELQKVKRMGFNMLRKHVKQECRRWYYHCDRLGILVMQDMPNGGGAYDPWYTMYLPNIGMRSFSDSKGEKFGRTDEESKHMFMNELDEMLDTLYNCVSIFAWVPFNEGWGQFDTVRVTDHIKQYDTTRLVDSASGWHDQGCGDFNSIHCYFRAYKPKHKDQRILFLSEFGGYSYLEWGHSDAQKLFGYKKFKNKLDLDNAVQKMYERDILKNVPKGLSGCILTQLTDVEDECNGILTADRRVVKIDEDRMKKMNDKIIRRMYK